MSQPWLADWNRQALEALFRLMPHSGTRVDVAEFLLLNPLVSMFPFAVVLYLQWRIEDQKTLWRRCRLLEVILATVAGVAFSFLLRLWISWPAPAVSPDFRELFPHYIQGLGNPNCFPSHSTLVYALAGAGLYPLSRFRAVLLFLFSLLAVSFPRIYLGGHYPVDVAVSLLLACAFLWAARKLGATSRGKAWLEAVAAGGRKVEFLLFVWLLEVAEGFGSVTTLLRDLGKAWRYLGYW
jgi:undecaprenyl-diphosphatase